MSAPKLTDKPAETLPVQRILKEVSRRIVGQDAMVERLLVGLLTGGHILLEGVPGLAKTLAVRTLAEIIHASFSRIQFTPDLLPADVIGTMIFDQKTQEFHVKKGPLFAQIILADEINRAPAKVQAALLEAMQEHQVTIGGHDLSARGAVPRAGHPEPDRARRHLSAARGAARPVHAQGARRLSHAGRGEGGPAADERRARRSPSSALLDPATILAARAAIAELYMDQKVVDYIVDLVRATRDPASVGSGGAQAAHRLRRLTARLDRAGAGGAGPRLPPRAGLRRARRTCARSRPTCCATASC